MEAGLVRYYRGMSRDEEDSGHEYETEVTCVEETPKALKLRRNDDGNTFFVPKSVVHEDSDVYEQGTDGKLIVKSWFAEKEGWS